MASAGSQPGNQPPTTPWAYSPFKCDTQRPCALHVRSSVEYITDAQDSNWCSRSIASSLSQIFNHRNNGSNGTAIGGGGGLSATPPPGEIPRDTALEQSGPSPEVNANHQTPHGYRQDTSEIKLTQEILSQLSPGSALNTDTSALPGGEVKDTKSIPSITVPIDRILGVQLPPKPVSDALVETYFNSVHWFMILLHEPSFRRRCDAVSLSGQALIEDLPFLVFLLSLLAVGAQYVNPSDRPQALADTDLEALQRGLLRCARTHLLDNLELGVLEGVQTCVLLSTFYLYHDRPNLGFIVHGIDVKCAHSMCGGCGGRYTPIAFENIKEYTYTIFAVINAIMVPSVYFFLPETARRSLEEMDLIFSKVKGLRGAREVVNVARETPYHYGRHGELLITAEEVEVGDSKQGK